MGANFSTMLGASIPTWLRLGLVAMAVGCLLESSLTVWAQPATAKAQATGKTPATGKGAIGVTDVIAIAGGGEIRGAVVSKLPDGTLDVAVQRDWLDAHAPEAAAALIAEERLQTRAVMTSLAKRLAATIDSLPESRTRTLGLLRREADRVDDWLAAAEQARQRDAAGKLVDEADDDARPLRPPAARRGETHFTLLRIAPQRVQKVRASGQAAQRIARWAWSERLEDVEGRSAPDLTKELKARGIDPLAPPPGLGDRLPPLPQDDREWQARMALVDDALGEPVSFQGFGDRVVKAGETEEGLVGILPQLAQLLGGGDGALGGLGLDEVLGGLQKDRLPAAPPASAANPPGQPAEKWLQSARTQAADVGRYRATRVKLDPAAGRAEVESVFEVRMPEGSWEMIWRDTQSADAAAVKEGAAEQVEADPRIAGLLQTIRGLGLVDEAAIKRAIGVGAATFAAQADLDSRFNAFRSQHIQRLDSPPLRWDAR